MKRSRRKRQNPKHLKVGEIPEGVDLAEVAERVDYTGSPYHKDTPSFAGRVPRPRPDASICPREFARDQARVREMLRAAVRDGHVSGDWSAGLPKYVWRREGDLIFEARLTTVGIAEYHGYPLGRDVTVVGLP